MQLLPWKLLLSNLALISIVKRSYKVAPISHAKIADYIRGNYIRSILSKYMYNIIRLIQIRNAMYIFFRYIIINIKTFQNDVQD